MAVRLQPPDPKRFAWEASTVVMEGAGGDIPWEDLSELLRRAPPQILSEGQAREAAGVVLRSRPEAGCEEEIEAARAVTRNNLLHRIDLEVRRIVSRVMKEVAKGRRKPFPTGLL